MNQIDEFNSKSDTSKRRISKEKYNSMENTQIKAHRENKRERYKENERRDNIITLLLYNTRLSEN